MAARLDCLIVGGGPAGLTGAIYAARFRLSVLVVDAGDSRASLIPCTHNHAGFPEGVSGAELLRKMAAQAERFGVRRVAGEVLRLTPHADGFRVESSEGPFEARAVLIATGVVNHAPRMDAKTHDEALTRGFLRYCPVCDGYEVTDCSVAVVGKGARAASEAIFLRSYTRRLCLVSPESEDWLDTEDRGRLAEAGVRLLGGPASDFRVATDGLSFACREGRLTFEAVYPAMGSTVRSHLTRELGAKTSSDGCIKVDSHQRTSIQGLYAAGDVASGLDQISHAMGQAGVAATTMRNELAMRAPLLR